METSRGFAVSRMACMGVLGTVSACLLLAGCAKKQDQSASPAARKSFVGATDPSQVPAQYRKFIHP